MNSNSKQRHAQREMSGWLSTMKASAKALKETRTLTLCAVLGALSAALRMVASIDIGPYIRIGFSDLPFRICDMLFGPVAGCILSGAMDIINYVLKPTGPFFLGFTLSAMVSSLICGLIYFRKKITLKRVFLANGLLALIVNIGMNTCWLVLLYGRSLSAILPARILKETIMWPINSLIFFAVVTAVEKTGIFSKVKRGAMI